VKYPALDKAKLKGKRVLLRAGFDVPMEHGAVKDPSRIEAIVPTMRHILDAGASLIILAHQGRPKGERVPDMSQRPLVLVLEKLLGVRVAFSDECVGDEAERKARALGSGEALLLENLRFEEGETSKDAAVRDAFGKRLAGLADIYVNDAFTNCHRDHASMTSIPRFLPGYLGFNALQEIEGLSKVTEKPRRPVALVISGAKIETKLPVIERFLSVGDDILVGGCIANTLIAARGFDVGKSKYDESEEMLEKARCLMLESTRDGRARIHIPRDAIVATQASEDAQKINIPVENITGDMAIYDIGKVTIERYKEVIAKAGTIVWNGPLGMHELNRFSHATKRIAEAVAAATAKGAISVIGGGDTLDFHERYRYPTDVYTFVSTAGGAMLDFISGKDLPALEALRR